jgi:hypothetical protein
MEQAGMKKASSRRLAEAFIKAPVFVGSCFLLHLFNGRAQPIAIVSRKYATP